MPFSQSLLGPLACTLLAMHSSWYSWGESLHLSGWGPGGHPGECTAAGPLPCPMPMCSTLEHGALVVESWVSFQGPGLKAQSCTSGAHAYHISAMPHHVHTEYTHLHLSVSVHSVSISAMPHHIYSLSISPKQHHCIIDAVSSQAVPLPQHLYH